MKNFWSAVKFSIYENYHKEEEAKFFLCNFTPALKGRWMFGSRRWLPLCCLVKQKCKQRDPVVCLSNISLHMMITHLATQRVFFFQLLVWSINIFLHWLQVFRCWQGPFGLLYEVKSGQPVPVAPPQWRAGLWSCDGDTSGRTHLRKGKKHEVDSGEDPGEADLHTSSCGGPCAWAGGHFLKNGEDLLWFF